MLLTAANLHYSYGDAPVLRDVSLTLAAGEVVALLGPNGSGKSTLIQCLLHDLHPVGTVIWNGTPAKTMRRRELAKLVAYLPQSPAYDSGQTVRDVLNLGRAPYWGAFGLESARDANAVAEVAAALDLTPLLHRPMDELSGGQRQRVFVGRCLAQEPRALLLDEPNTYLDLRHGVELSALLRQLCRDRGLGILAASHDLNLAAAYADRLVLLEHGTVAAEGPPDAVLRPDLLSRVYGVDLESIERAGGGVCVLPAVTKHH